MKRIPSDKTILAWQAEIKKSGIKRINTRALLREFGLQRRGSEATRKVVAWFKALKPRIHPNGLEYAASLDEPVQLSAYELTRIGRLVAEEQILMDNFENAILPQLPGLRDPHENFQPAGTRHRLDFLCTDRAGRSVVVELKREDGEGRAVEQVLCYMRHLRLDPRCTNPRGIIITGCADLPTRKALEELSRTDEIAWYVYGIDEDDNLSLQKIRVNPVHKE